MAAAAASGRRGASVRPPCRPTSRSSPSTPMLAAVRDWRIGPCRGLRLPLRLLVIPVICLACLRCGQRPAEAAALGESLVDLRQDFFPGPTKALSRPTADGWHPPAGAGGG